MQPLVASAQALSVKDPLSYSLGQYGFMLGMSILGGLVSWYARVRAGKAELWSINALIGEVATSAFAGLLAFYLCEWTGFPPLLTASVVGISGHMGTRGIQLLERLGESRIKAWMGVNGGSQ
ncbi:phage holin family protein [Aquabacterium sp.]|uniref:phage holin family protein n=1 Tax=Aquabacterium sp. TaxID=1872578 RepID=UPI003BAF6C06